MICYTDKLDSAINTSCPTTFGMERNAYLCLRSEINPKTETDLVVDFVPRFMIPIYQPSENAYKPKSDGERNAYGLNKFQKSIEVFLVANTALTQEQIMWLKDEDWVAVLKQIDGTYIVFGFERGLRLKTTSQDLNSTDTHGGILLTLDENQVNTPMLFGSETLYNWAFNFDVIYGGTIANGGSVKLTIDSDKTGYIKLPNGTILTTVAGVIDTTYSGVGGSITYYVPKNSTVCIVSSSGLAGHISYSGFSALSASVCEITTANLNNCKYISIWGNTALANLYANSAIILDAVDCSLTAKSIGDILYSAYIDNREDVVFDFSGGTNADDESIGNYLSFYYALEFGDVKNSLVALGGTITVNIALG